MNILLLFIMDFILADLNLSCFECIIYFIFFTWHKVGLLLFFPVQDSDSENSDADLPKKVISNGVTKGNTHYHATETSKWGPGPEGPEVTTNLILLSFFTDQCYCLFFLFRALYPQCLWT